MTLTSVEILVTPFMIPTSKLPLLRSETGEIDLISRWSDFKLISYDLKAADDYDIDIAFVDHRCLLFYPPFDCFSIV